MDNSSAFSQSEAVTSDRFLHLNRESDRQIDHALHEFRTIRPQNINRLKQLVDPDRHLEEAGLHPEFGPVKVRELLSTWVVHDLTHIAQIVRVLAGRYREDVGPWSAYLGILGNRQRPAASTSRGLLLLKTIRKMFDHLHWANERIVRALQLSERDNLQARRLFSHILNAERVWLTRLQGEDSSHLPIWADKELEECARLVELNREGYAAYLDSIGEDGLDQLLIYKNSQGT